MARTAQPAVRSTTSDRDPSPPAAEATIAASGLWKRFDRVTAVADASLGVAAGRVLAIVGPSGCGKSTLLRLVAGLETPDAGRVTLAGRDVTHLPAHRRPIGLVFQDHALFPHLDVQQNVAFGLVEARWSGREAAERVRELLDDFDLARFAGRRVDALSGGERQRVALARALAPRPPVLLLDEPLASLDRHLRERLALELARTLRAPDLASLFVTHDQDEAVTIGDDLAVMRAGRIVQIGPADEVPAQPVDTWVARFFGHRNLFTGSRAQRMPRAGERGAVLLRDDLVRVRLAGDDRPGPGEPLAAEVRGIARDRLGLRLELSVPSLEATLWWRGAARELVHLPAIGEGLTLLVPGDAWWPLTPDGEPPGGAPPDVAPAEGPS